MKALLFIVLLAFAVA